MASEPIMPDGGGRRSERWPFSAEVQFRSGTRRANVRLRDISPHGARVQGVYLVRADDHFYIKLPGIEPIEARVAWVEDFEFGCEFARPINQSVLDALVRSC